MLDIHGAPFHYTLHSILVCAWVYLCILVFQKKRNVCPKSRLWMTKATFGGMGTGLLLFGLTWLVSSSQQGSLQFSDPFVLGVLWVILMSFFFLYEAVQLFRDQSIICHKTNNTIRFLYISGTVITSLVFSFILYLRFAQDGSSNYDGY